MIASALPASVLVSGDVVAQSGDWVVTYDTEHKVAFFVHPVYASFLKLKYLISLSLARTHALVGFFRDSGHSLF